MSREPEDGTGDCEPDIPPKVPDDEFDRIIAGWRAEGSAPSWPDAEPTTDVPADGPGRTGGAPSADDPTAAGGAVPPGAAEPGPAELPPTHRPGPALPIEDDDHFHPPEPPPLPRPGPPALVGGVLIALGLLLVVVPSTLGLSSFYGLPLGLVAVAAGLTWLVMRMWPSEDADDPHDDNDDGAVI